MKVHVTGSRPIGFTLPLVAILMAGISCARSEAESWQPPAPVRIQGGEAWYNLFPSWITWGSFTVGEKDVGMLLRDGDVLIPTGEGPLIEYRSGDGARLNVATAEDRTLLSGKTVALLLKTGESGWEWLKNAATEDLSSLRLIVMPGEIDAGHLEILKRLSSMNPHVGLWVESDSVLRQLLPLFTPRFLSTGGGVIGADLSKELSRQKQLVTVICSADEPGSLDFLSALPGLRRLAISEWDPAVTGPIPQGLRELKSLVVAQSDIADLSALSGVSRGLEELSLVICESLADLSGLESFANLRTLILNGSGPPDLFNAAGLQNLRWLGLPSKITQDRFAAVLKAHPDLRILEVVGCENVKDLYSMKSLRFVGIPVAVYTDSPERAEALEKALPDAMVVAGRPLCLGSGWILALVPAAVLLGFLRTRLRRGKPACSRNA
jgi:hypothetical protein